MSDKISPVPAVMVAVFVAVGAMFALSDDPKPTCTIATTHTVVRGETLSAIVRSDKVSDLVPADSSKADYNAWIIEIQLLNELNSPGGIRAGQQLRIPAFGSSC